MKKLISISLCGLAVLGMYGQKANVDQAKKLAGKTDKIEEARSLIKEAIANPETSGQALTYYIAGKIEWDAYDKNVQKQMSNPDGVDPLAMADELMNGYNYFLQTFPLDLLPNEKGEVKPKYTNELQKKIAEKKDDFWTAARDYHNADKRYPEAYNAFLIYADMPDLEVLGKKAPFIPDTVRAVAYYNAASEAYGAEANEDAAKAFRKARENNYPESKPYLFEIVSWEKIAQADSTRFNEAKQNIFAIAKAGYEKYEMGEPLFLRSMVNALLEDEKTDDAEALLKDAANRFPDQASIYGLLGLTYDRADNDEASEATYKKAVAMDTADFETLRLAANKLLRMGQSKWNDIDLGDPDIIAKKKAVRENYFLPAKEIAERGLTMATQQAQQSQIESLLENVEYLMSLR